MILSVSRRSDIPAFFSQWFLNRVEEGWCEVANPYNLKQLTRISLHPKDVAAFVFWSKDFRPLLPHLPNLREQGFRFVFLYTITGYGGYIEPGVPDWKTSVETLRTLAQTYGPERIAWRYDPVIFSTSFGPQWHIDNFSCLAAELSGYTHRVIFSLVDDYRRARAKIRQLAKEGEVFHQPTQAELATTFAKLSGVAREKGFFPQACAEEVDLSTWGIAPGACIDPGWLTQVFGREFRGGKDKGQRAHCLCAPSRDIGIYGTCHHGCAYCYAGTGKLPG